jgi:hypothetical protein
MKGGDGEWLNDLTPYVREELCFIFYRVPMLSHEFFRGLAEVNKPAFRQLCTGVRVQSLAKGDFITRAGSQCNCVYMVIDGAVLVELSKSQRQTTGNVMVRHSDQGVNSINLASDLQQIKAPCWIGFLPMIREEMYPQTVACVVDCEMLLLHATTFWAAVNEYPEMEDYTRTYIDGQEMVYDIQTDPVYTDVPPNLQGDWEKWITTRLRSMDRPTGNVTRVSTASRTETY